MQIRFMPQGRLHPTIPTAPLEIPEPTNAPMGRPISRFGSWLIAEPWVASYKEGMELHARLSQKAFGQPALKQQVRHVVDAFADCIAYGDADTTRRFNHAKASLEQSLIRQGTPLSPKNPLQLLLTRTDMLQEANLPGIDLSNTLIMTPMNIGNFVSLTGTQMPLANLKGFDTSGRILMGPNTCLKGAKYDENTLHSKHYSHVKSLAKAHAMIFEGSSVQWLLRKLTDGHKKQES